MTAKDLKNALLQEAIQGKLVPQIASEGNARDLLEEIRKSHTDLQIPTESAGKKKGDLRSKSQIRVTKKANVLPEITEDEIPFDIPESWCWCRLGDLTEIVTKGSSPSWQGINYVDNGILFITSENVGDEELLLSKKKYLEPKFNDIQSRSILKKGDLLTNIVGASIGRTAIFDLEINNANINQAVALIRLKNIELNSYLVKVLNSKVIFDQMSDNTVNTARANISLTTVENFRIPLPPLAEQKRIVAAIEKFMPLIEEYGKKETVLNQLNAQIGTLTKKAILQEAVQGKLVPQIASEGNARDLLEQIKAQKAALIKDGKIKKEKPLPEITEDEIPFDIPENWCWCRLGELGNFIRGSGIKRDETTKTGFPCVRYGEMYTTYKLRFSQTKSFTTKEVFDKCHKIYSNDILMALTGENKWDIALAAVYEGNDELAMGGDLCKFTPCKCDSLFLVYLINSPYGIEYKRNTSTGDIIVHTSTSKLGNFIVPLPPLSEQKRIVAAIEQLLPLCERLGK